MEKCYHDLDVIMGQLLGMREKENQLAAYFKIERLHVIVSWELLEEQSQSSR